MDPRFVERVKRASKAASAERLGRFYGFVEGLEKKKRAKPRGFKTFAAKHHAHHEAINYRRELGEARAFEAGKRLGRKRAKKILGGF